MQVQQSRSKKANLNLPVSKVENEIREYTGLRVNKYAPVYMTAAIEYLAMEILELAGKQTLTGRRVRIKPRDVTLGIFEDDDLKMLFKDSHIMKGGVAFSNQ